MQFKPLLSLVIPALVGFASALHAQDINLPAAAQLGSCKPLRFNPTGLDLPPHVDVLVYVDAKGVPERVQTFTASDNSALLASVENAAMSCKYSAAVVDGRKAAGQTRFLMPIPQSPGQRPGALPAIADLASCAPKPEDYPKSAQRANVTGTTEVTFTVDAEGKLSTFGVSKSSGSLVLDFTTLVKLAACVFVPGKAPDGSPIGGTFTAHYKWDLR